MTRFHFVSWLRATLGRGYSVADEEGAADGDLRLVVLRRGKESQLVVETRLSWVRELDSSPAMEDRMLVKHMAVFIKRFFAHPDLLPDQAFSWPGTAVSRGQVRLALDPRKQRRRANQSGEAQP
jgi:hypothetical protein